MRRFFERPLASAVNALGDDCVLLRPNAGLELALTTDMLVEGRHFARDADPRQLGHKALAVNLSDLAAMGAAPRWALLSIGLPSADERWLEAFSAGLFALAARFGVELIGGDTTRADTRVLNIVALGEVPAGVALYRSGARAGDDIWVSGELGGAALALRRPDIAETARRLHEPEPRVELGERLRGIAHAAIDVSDGLVGDLGHIVERSRLGAQVEYARVPRPAVFARLNDPALERDCVLSGGDDYELVFTAAPAQRPALEALERELGLPLTRIGAMRAGPATLEVHDAGGRPLPLRRGFDHFA
ncbi:MAG TPA: thiamine-phosphate kinase [Burkholderiales bacterium]